MERVRMPQYHAPAMNESRSRRERENESWAHYWELGLLSSLGNAYTGTYEGAVREHWRAFFAALADGSRILDVGTGNGALPAIAIEVARERDVTFEVHGIDLAPIRPLETVKHQRELIQPVHFHANTPAEATPFEAAWFHAITAHYGFEYTDRPACARELGRVAAGGAVLGLVIHHPESIILQTAREELANAGMLLDESQFFDRARALLETAARASDPAARAALARDARAERQRHALNEAAAAVAAAADASPHPDLLRLALNAFQTSWRHLSAGDGAAARAALAAGERGITENRQRLRDLASAYLGREQVDAARENLIAAGFEMAVPDRLYHESGALLGWVLNGRRQSVPAALSQ
jgi:ubiquinone/menaquinone biosynthesis C-methylase UbiE